MLILVALAGATMQPVTGGPILGHAADDDPFTAIVSPASKLAAQRCAPLLERRARGELSTIDVSSRTRSGSRTTIRGVMRAFVRPAAAAPGEMTPMHVINAPFSFRCTLSKARPIVARVSRLPG